LGNKKINLQLLKKFCSVSTLFGPELLDKLAVLGFLELVFVYDFNHLFWLVGKIKHSFDFKTGLKLRLQRI
jgi:hypothetical protein